MGGGGWAFAWGPQDDSQIRSAAIHAALDHGVNWIDTAAGVRAGTFRRKWWHAALAGRSETALFVFTKCEADLERPCAKFSRCLKADSIRRECENSLRAAEGG